VAVGSHSYRQEVTTTDAGANVRRATAHGRGRAGKGKGEGKRKKENHPQPTGIVTKSLKKGMTIDREVMEYDEITKTHHRTDPQ